MSNAVPLIYRGKGRFESRPRYEAKCDRLFGLDAVHWMSLDGERSKKSHDHYFSIIRGVWLNLPEIHEERFPSEDHLRKWFLVKTGYCIETVRVFDTPEAAQMAGSLCEATHDYAVVGTFHCTVRVWVAESQSKKAMGARRFQESKDAVLTALSQFVGYDVTEWMPAA